MIYNTLENENFEESSFVIASIFFNRQRKRKEKEKSTQKKILHKSRGKSMVEQSFIELAKLYTSFNDFRNDYRNHNLNLLILKNIRKKIFLDIGSGASYLVHLAKSIGYKAYGLEPNDLLIKHGEEIFGKLKIFHLHVEDLNRLDITPDTISMADVLEHIKKDYETLKIIFNKLNKGGRAIIVVPAFPSLYGKRDKKFGHYRRYSKRNLSDLLRSIGFKVESIRFWNFIGLIPYFLAEKSLKREISSGSRNPKRKGSINFILNNFFHYWFKFVENNINFRIGLSIICICSK